jgi:ribonuclease HII
VKPVAKPPARPGPDLSHERAALAGLPPGATVCGVDEAGRGPWAGPVAAAAAVIDADRLDPQLAALLDDSKKLTAARRQAAFAALQAAREAGAVALGVGWGTVAEIDGLGLGRAADLAMTRAIEALPAPPTVALVDGKRVPPLPCPGRALVGGDGLSLSIAAASIVAKVLRDAEMLRLDAECPGYGWARNQGYGVAAHAAAIKMLGVTAHHRRSFRPIHNILCGQDLKDQG